MTRQLAGFLLRFGFSGVISTCVAYVSFPLLFILYDDTVGLYDSDYLTNPAWRFNIVFLLSTFVNVTISFILQKNLVFKTSNPWLAEYIRFWLGSIIIIAGGYGVLYYLVDYKLLKPLLANFMVVTLSAVLNIITHSLVTFRVVFHKPKLL